MGTTAERMQIALDIRGMKQSELSEKAKIGKSSIHAYLTGEYLPKQNNIYKMALALDVSESWLMGYDVPMDRPTSISQSSLLISGELHSSIQPMDIVAEPPLSAAEESLVGKFRSLNTEGQSKVISYTDDLLRAGIYKNVPAPDSLSKNA